MSASKFSRLSKQFCNVNSLKLEGAYYASLLGNACKHPTLIHKNITSPNYICKRYFSDLTPAAAIYLVNSAVNIITKFVNKIKTVSKSRSGEREVYLLTDHFKYHKNIPRVDLVKNLSSTIQSIKGNGTKLIYIGGLPGTGKKGLARQYAEQQYENIKKKKNLQAFVATIDVSDPISFCEDLFKIAEKTDIIENRNQFDKKIKKIGGYKEILLKLSSRLQNRSGWVLVLNGVKFNTELQWRVGEKGHNKVNEMNEALQNLDLSDVSPERSSNGTIIVTTCDYLAKGHHAKNVKYFDMPTYMTDQEAMQLLEYASDQQKLQQCQSAWKVIHSLQNVPTSVYW